MNDTNPIVPWSEFGSSVLIVALFTLMFYGMLFAAIALPLGLLMRKNVWLFLSCMAGIGVFLVCLAMVSALADGVWTCSVLGWMYRNDYMDAEADFIPFLPFDGSINPRLIGISYPDFQLIWVSFSAMTWSLTLLLWGIIKLAWEKRATIEKYSSGLKGLKIWMLLAVVLSAGVALNSDMLKLAALVFIPVIYFPIYAIFALLRKIQYSENEIAAASQRTRW